MNEQTYEIDFWSDCLLTWGEERKHFVYAKLMGIELVGYSFRVNHANVIDIGSGPVSMLLKCLDRGSMCVVLDPLLSYFPHWVRERYVEADIDMSSIRGEDLQGKGFDEAWIYNCLQHVDDAEAVISNARKAAKAVRIFEWVDIPAYEGHPQELKAADLEKWLGGSGVVTDLATEGCYGRAFSGVFS